jgi:hypothetical protein
MSREEMGPKKLAFKEGKQIVKTKQPGNQLFEQENN